MSIRILHLEDKPLDAQLVEMVLRRERIDCSITRLDSRQPLIDRLASGTFDLVLSDHSIPEFDGLSAFRYLRERDQLTPFILVSGSLGEEAASETIRAGVTDYVLKDRLMRLPGCVRRALAEARDRRDRRDAVEALRRGEQRFHVALATISEGLLVIDNAGCVVVANPAAADLLGRDTASLTGMTAVDLGINIAEAASDVALTITRPDGSTSSTLVNRRPVAHDGIPDGSVVTMHDVSERERLQDQIIRAQKMNAIGRLTAGIAHDFNNLLVVINNCADMVIDAAKAEQEVFERALTIRRAGERAAQLTQQLLAFSRQHALKPVLLDLRRVVEDLVPMLRRLIGEGVELIVSGDTNVAGVSAYAGQIDQVIMNLVVNARDAMPDGGRLEITVANKALDSSHDTDRVRVKPGPYVELLVSDTGIGMSAATRDRIFEPFFTTKAIGKGTGLGLPTVYRIVKQSGGYIWATSTPGEGTTFRIYMPVVEGSLLSDLTIIDK